MHVLGSKRDAWREVGIHGMGNLVEIVPQPFQLGYQHRVGRCRPIAERNDAGVALAYILLG